MFFHENVIKTTTNIFSIFNEYEKFYSKNDRVTVDQTIHSSSFIF